MNWLLNKLGYSKKKQITVMTIGNNGFPATPEQLKLLAQAYSKAKDGGILIWSHTLDVRTIEV